MSGEAAARTPGGQPRKARRGWPIRLLLWVIVTVSVLVAAGVAGAVVLSRTASGRELALEWALSRVRPLVNGSIRVGSVGPGGLLAGATLHDVQLSDSLGRPVLVVDSIRARYSVAELFGGPPALADLRIWSPVFTLDPAPGERVDLAGLLVPGAGGPDTLATPSDAARSPALRIRGARIHGGTVIMRDDGGERRVEGIEAEFPRVDIRPDRDLYVAASMEAAALSYPLGRGRLALAGIQGTVEVGPSGITVDAERFRLPGSEGSGRVLAERRVDGWRRTFDLDLSRLSMTDLSWLDERLDHGVARGEVRIAIGADELLIDVTGGRVEADPGGFAVSGGMSLGETTRFRNLRVAPDGLATDDVERWLPGSLPVSGTLSGDVSFDGVPGRLAIAGDLALVDGVTDDTVAHLSGGGTVVGRRALEATVVDAISLDYGLLSAIAPGFPWRGRGDLSFQADGDLTRGMEVSVVAQHSLAGGSPSSIALAGTLYGDTVVSVVDVDATLSPLSLSMLGQLYPNLPLSGEVEGSLSVAGSLDRLGVVAELETAAGLLAAEGLVNVRDPAAGYRMTVSARNFRVAELVGGLPDSTVVSGTLSVNGSGLDRRSIRGALDFEAGPSSFGALRLDSAEANVWVDDEGLLHVESLYANAGGVVVQGRGGSLGAAPGVTGEGVALSLSSPSIRPLRPIFMGENLVAWDELAPIEQGVMIEFDGVDPDTLPLAREIRFDGKVDGEIRLGGGLGDLTAAAAVAIEGLEYGLGSARSLDVDVTASGLRILPPDSAQAAAAPPLVLDGMIAADSISFDDREFRSARVQGRFGPSVGGRLHALVVRSMGANLAESESYEAQAVIRLDEEGGRIDLDRLNLVFDERRWGLRGPASFEWSPDAVVVNDFGLIRPGSEGLRALADGRFARRDGESDFELQVTDLDLGVVGRLLQLGEPPAGVASVDLRVTGSSAEPEWEGSVQVDDAGFGTLRFDRVAAGGTYADRTLAAGIEYWTGGRRTIRVEGTIPLDLRLEAVEDRIPDEPLELDVIADSFPAAVILGVLNSLEEVDGTITGTVKVLGRPSDLEPDGAIRIENASGLMTPLGIRLSSVDIDMRLSSDGTVAVDGSGVSGGTVQVRGTVDAGDPADVLLDLAFWPQELQVVDRRDMEAAVSGDSIALTGSFNYPLIEGQLDVVGGTVFIEEFQRTAGAVDFYDPELFSAATVQIGSRGEAEDASESVRRRNPFLENLRVAIDMQVGRGNWLRSRDMNVETEGDLSLTFDRQGNQLILNGEVGVVRGTYNLGPRTFRMTDGAFQFVGTPGFNPGLSVTAETSLRTREGEPLVIAANISGTLLSPTLSLSSDAESAISEADLVNYLVLGRPTSALVGEGGAASVGAGTNLLLGQVFNELGYLLALELDLDHLSVSQAEQSQANAAFGASSLQVEVGWYVLDNVFLTGVYQRGFCADPTLPVSSGGVRVEVEMPRDVTLEGFLEGQCTRERYRGLGDLSLELARIWGFSFFREWGY